MAAHHVSIQKIEAPGASYVGPTALPYSAGTIASGDGQQLYVEISGASLTSGTPYPFELHGSCYELGHERSDEHHGAVCRFTARAVVAPQSPGNGGLPKSSTTTPVFTVTTAVYPGGPLFHSPGDQPNEEGEFLPPLGQPQNFFTVAPLQSVLNRTAAFSPNDQSPPAGAGPNSVVFLRNQNGGAYSALPPDPNAGGADPSGFVLISANNANGGNAAAVSFSKDFGSTFTTVPLTSGTGFKDPGNPGRTDFFPESDGGLCCDRTLHSRRRPRADAVLPKQASKLIGCPARCRRHKGKTLSESAVTHSGAALKVGDVDSTRITLRIQQGKGGKDRYAMLSRCSTRSICSYRSVGNTRHAGLHRDR